MKPSKSAKNEAPKKGPKKNKEYYVKPEEFHDAIVNYYASNTDVIPHELGDMVQKIDRKSVV